MTVTRVILSAVHMKNNITRQNAAVGFITGLEPVTGVINACPPHFPPVWRKSMGSDFVATISQALRSEKSQSQISKATDSIQGSKSDSIPQKKNQFRHLGDDSILFTSVSANSVHQHQSWHEIQVHNAFFVENVSLIGQV